MPAVRTLDRHPSLARGNGAAATEAGAWGALISVLPPARASDFADFTYPAFRRHLDGSSGFRCIHVGAELGGLPCGLAFGLAGESSFEVASVVVREDLADGALEEALLRRLVAEFAAHGLMQGAFHPSYPVGDARLPALLRRCGWQGPVLRQVTAASTTERLLALPFAMLGEIRPGYDLLPWHRLPTTARAGIDAALAGLPATVRDDIAPDRYAARAVPDLSFVLMRGAEAIGWHLPERFGDSTLRWTCSVVLPGHWAAAAVLQLWVHALRQQQAMGIPRVIWGTPMAHPNMARFILRRLRPALEHLRLGTTFLYGPTNS